MDSASLMAVQILGDEGGRVPEAIATAVTIGAYDGIHRGHQLILANLRRFADERGLATAVVTFDVHPARVLRPDAAPKLLTTREQRREIFEAEGVDYLYLIHFTPERAETDSATFAKEVLAESLRANVIVVGEDFHFGRGRGGNVDSLRSVGAEQGFEVVGLELFGDDGSTGHISSTAIRAALGDGDVAAAAAMLGRPYEIRGEVIEGDKRGRLIGFPTANIPVDKHTAWPSDGVYAGWAVDEAGTRHSCAINIGKRPTFYHDVEHSLLEAHLIDFEGDLYGTTLRVEFVERLRSEQRFDGIDAIRTQLELDIAAARDVLARRVEAN